MRTVRSQSIVRRLLFDPLSLVRIRHSQQPQHQGGLFVRCQILSCRPFHPRSLTHDAQARHQPSANIGQRPHEKTSSFPSFGWAAHRNSLLLPSRSCRSIQSPISKSNSAMTRLTCAAESLQFFLMYRKSRAMKSATCVSGSEFPLGTEGASRSRRGGNTNHCESSRIQNSTLV